MLDSPARQIQYNAWAQDLYAPHGTLPYDYMLSEGGRGCGKTFAKTQALAIKGHQQSLRIGVGREHLSSIDKSAKPEIEERIKSLGLMRPDCYRSTISSIDHANGTHFFFIGLSKMSEEDIKGLALVDIFWIEEAHRCSHASWELLVPTIRKDGAQIWASWNNKYRTDAISKFQLSSTSDPLVWHRRVTYRDNAFFTERNERDRLRDKEKNPERYPHVWEGDFDDVAATKKVLPFALLQQCVDAWPKRPPKGAFSTAGLDPADTGVDKNAFAIRTGPTLWYANGWHGSQEFTLSDTARKAGRIAEKEGVNRLLYDAGGIGAGLRGPLKEMRIKISLRGCFFGGKVEYGKVPFIRIGDHFRTNEEYFANWASMAGWILRLRANNTQRLMKGESIDPGKCLFINPEIPHLQDFLAELAQPDYDDSTGKLKINKQPREPGESKPPSPDGYDSAILAFSTDMRRISRLLVRADRPT